MTRLRSAASTRTRRSRRLSAQSAQEVTAKAPGARKRWPSVRSADASPCPSSSPSRRSNGTTAPSSRQTMRRSGRTQVKLLRAAPAHRLRPGEAAQQRRDRLGDQVGGGHRRRQSSPAPSSRPPDATARASRRACAGSRPAPARVRWCAGRAPLCCWRRPRVPPPLPVQCVAGRRTCGRWRAPVGTRASTAQPAQVLGRPRLHPRRNFLTEQFEKELRHVSPSAPARRRSGRSRYP